MDWRTPTLADAAILQECALKYNDPQFLEGRQPQP